MNYTNTDLIKLLSAYLPNFLSVIVLGLCCYITPKITQVIKTFLNKIKFFIKIEKGWSVLLSFIVSLLVVVVVFGLKISFPIFSIPITFKYYVISIIIVWLYANGEYLLGKLKIIS
jgi:hypothetical protein